MRYLTMSKFSRSLVHKKNFSLIWQVFFKLGYVLCQERYNTTSEFEWTLRKVTRYNNSRQIYKQAIIKFSLAHSFRKMFFIGQNLKHVHMTYSFLELLIFFCLTQVHIDCLEFISQHIAKILYLNTNSKENQSWNKSKHFHLFLSWNKNKHFHMFFKNSLRTIFITSQLHERIFRSSSYSK